MIQLAGSSVVFIEKYCMSIIFAQFLYRSNLFIDPMQHKLNKHNI